MEEEQILASLARSRAKNGRPWLIAAFLCAVACVLTLYSTSSGTEMLDPGYRPEGLVPYSTDTGASMLSVAHYSGLAVSVATQRALCAIWGLCAAGCLLAYFAARRQALRDALLIRLLEGQKAAQDAATKV